MFAGALPRPCKCVLALTVASLACHRALCAKTFEFHYGLGRHRGLPAGLHPRPCSLFSCEHFGASSSDARVVCGVRCRVLVLATLRVPFLGCFLELEAHRGRFVNLLMVRQRLVTVSNSLLLLPKPPIQPLTLARPSAEWLMIVGRLGCACGRSEEDVQFGLTWAAQGARRARS